MDVKVCTGDSVNVEGCENNILPRKFKLGSLGYQIQARIGVLGYRGVCIVRNHRNHVILIRFEISEAPKSVVRFEKSFIHISLQHTCFVFNFQYLPHMSIAPRVRRKSLLGRYRRQKYTRTFILQKN